MRVFRVSLPDFYQITQADQDAVMRQMVTLFAAVLRHCRLMTFVVPANLDALARARRKVAMSRGEQWERVGLLEEVRLIEGLAQGGEMRRTRHYLIDFDGIVTETELQRWGVQAEAVPFPPLPIVGDYAEQTDHMRPVLREAGGALRLDHSRYQYSIVSSHQLLRIWDWRYPLAQQIADADGPQIIVVDSRRIHPEKVAMSAEFWQGMVLNGKDRMAHVSRDEAEVALNTREEAVHHVRVLTMVLDKNTSRLRERVRLLAQASAQYMKVDKLRGYQAAAAGWFAPLPKPGGTPVGHFNTLSTTVAAISGLWGVGRDQTTQGIYLGIGTDDVAPHINYLRWEGNDPFHGIVLGKTGWGKTVAIQALGWRLAEQGTQVVVLEPQGHSRRLAQLAGWKHVSYNELSYDATQFNIFDWVMDGESAQLDHVTVLLKLLLNPIGDAPRIFSVQEHIAIRNALRLTYADYAPEELIADPTLTPTMRIFCTNLRQVAQAAATVGAATAGAAASLADDLEGLYVYGDYAATFNQQTNVDLNLRQRLVLFNFKDVPEERRGLFYYLILTSINRRIRSGFRKRAIFVDEVHYMNRTGELMRFLAHMVKTVRTFGCAVVMVDQDLEAFVGVDGAQAESMAMGMDIASGQFILNNITWLLALGMKRDAAYRLARHYQDEILPSHAEFIATVGRDKRSAGMAVLRYAGKADMLYLRLRQSEAKALLGS